MEQAPPKSSARFGVFDLDMRSGELRKAGTRIRLQDQPLKILMVLLEEPGAVVTREDLKRRIWPNEPFGDFDHAVNVAIAKLRTALSDSADTPRYVETLPRRGYRFIFPVTTAAQTPDANGSAGSAVPPAAVEKRDQFSGLLMIAVVVAVVILSASAWWWITSHREKKLSDKDKLVLADFENTTGDAVFDGTIRQALGVQLEQSPFLSLISDATVRETLRLMNQPPDARLAPDVAQELCIRTGSAAVLNGSIAKLGSEYVLGLKVTDCRTGDSLVQEQVTAEGKEEVLKALAQAASFVRKKLGESVGTVQKYNTPLEQVTTPSLEALHAYSLGRTTLIDREDPPGAIQLFQRAIRLDPNFAMAYASLGLAYGEYSQEASVLNYRKAYELRDRVSDRERFYVEAHYHEAVTGDLEKARQVYELWSQLYPRDDIPHLNLGGIYSHFGEYENARKEAAESLRLLPGDCLSSAMVVTALIRLNRFDEARALMKSTQERKASCYHLQLAQYSLAFLQNNQPEMSRIANASGERWEIQFSYFQAQTAAYYGRLRESHELLHRALSAAGKSGQEQLGAFYEELAAESEALIGDAELAKREAKDGLARSRVRDIESLGALALALAHDDRSAQSLANDLVNRFHESTLVQANYVPSVEAQLALNRKDGPKALEYLQAAAPHEVGDPDGSNAWFPTFLRGQAYLMARQGREAAAEFQKILDHRGIVLCSSIGALARLQIARAFIMQGETAKARVAYQDFLNLWNTADSDIPVLKQAKAEYAKLQ
jgi:DNA-binding winged helix-turn-helix (wHTH) protein